MTEGPTSKGYTTVGDLKTLMSGWSGCRSMCCGAGGRRRSS